MLNAIVVEAVVVAVFKFLIKTQIVVTVVQACLRQYELWCYSF